MAIALVLDCDTDFRNAFRSRSRSALPHFINRPMVAVVAGIRRIGDRAVLMVGEVPIGGREFPPTGSGVPAAAPLIIPSQIGEAQAGAGVIRSQSPRRRRAWGLDLPPADRSELRPLNTSQMRSRSLPPTVHTERSPLRDTV